MQDNKDFFRAVKAFANESKQLTETEKDQRRLSELASNHAFKEFKEIVDRYLASMKKKARGVRDGETATMALYRKLVVEALEDTFSMFFNMVDQLDEQYNQDE